MSRENNHRGGRAKAHQIERAIVREWKMKGKAVKASEKLKENNMVYRICGGIGITLLALSMLGVHTFGDQIAGIFLLIGGIALLAGL